MIVITRRAQREHKDYSVWKPHRWHTPFFANNFGKAKCRQAKLICQLPCGFGLFWTFGKEWFE